MGLVYPAIDLPSSAARRRRWRRIGLDDIFWEYQVVLIIMVNCVLLIGWQSYWMAPGHYVLAAFALLVAAWVLGVLQQATLSTRFIAYGSALLICALTGLAYASRDLHLQGRTAFDDVWSMFGGG